MARNDCKTLSASFHYSHRCYSQPPRHSCVSSYRQDNYGYRRLWRKEEIYCRNISKDLWGIPGRKTEWSSGGNVYKADGMEASGRARSGPWCLLYLVIKSFKSGTEGGTGQSIEEMGRGWKGEWKNAKERASQAVPPSDSPARAILLALSLTASTVRDLCVAVKEPRILFLAKRPSDTRITTLEVFCSTISLFLLPYAISSVFIPSFSPHLFLSFCLTLAV